VSTVPELLSTVAALKPDDAVTLKVLRRGDTTDVKVTIGKRPKPKKS
jgi:S1-C subfamily serine protease